ncbi:MAG: secondary thiamine-phosphate synthase enzyme YjbQ [Spirochaetia bacterium]|nr:secondary thiamine-phosphate synthase enzyme YjbQ [Spirochaetia bacterium]
MYVIQKQISLTGFSRGFHLITKKIIQELPELKQIKSGLCHLLIMHTSASLTLNENADPTVRDDFESYFLKAVPENEPYYQHTLEGYDDMPAHIKSSILGATLTLPVTNGELILGTWQGIYLCEHRNHGGTRKINITILGI